MNPRMIVPLFTFLILSAFSAARQSPVGPQTPEKRLLKGGRPVEEPDGYKIGFSSIDSHEALSLLSFLASDLLEGREPGTRGHQLAGEYAASLLDLWKIRPGGDVKEQQRAFTQKIILQVS